MKALLTASGIKNRSIHSALVDMLGRPIAECDALFIPTANESAIRVVDGAADVISEGRWKLFPPRS